MGEGETLSGEGENKPAVPRKYLWEPGRVQPGVDHQQLQEYRRDFQIADWAARLGIPTESLLLNETVAAYVGVVRDVGAALDGLEYQWRDDGVKPGSNLSQRFDVAALLLKNAHAILRETLECDPVSGVRLDGGEHPQGRATPWMLALDISEALSPYGWWLSETDETNEPRPRRDPEGIWHDPARDVLPRDPYAGRPEPQRAVVAEDAWW
jgi:hypothetical protein